MSETVFMRAVDFAVRKHQGQLDKSGKPYIMHCLRVAEAVGGPPALRAIAVLHDVLEDTYTSVTELQREFPKPIAYIVVVLTRKADESYAKYIDRVKDNLFARRIKLADLRDNMDWQRAKQIVKENPSLASGLLHRYVEAMLTLMVAENEAASLREDRRINKHED